MRSSTATLMKLKIDIYIQMSTEYVPTNIILVMSVGERFDTLTIEEKRELIMRVSYVDKPEIEARVTIYHDHNSRRSRDRSTKIIKGCRSDISWHENKRAAILASLCTYIKKKNIICKALRSNQTDHHSERLPNWKRLGR